MAGYHPAPAALRPQSADELRRIGREAFERLGFPNTHLEEWRFTNVSALSRLTLRPGITTPPADLTPARIDDLAVSASGAFRAVTVNGAFCPALSTLDGLPAGVRVLGLAAALAAEPELVWRYLARVSVTEDHPFRALNAAHLADGIFVHVAEGVACDRPIHVVNVAVAAGNATGTSTAHPRNLYVIEPGASVTIVEAYVGHDAGVSFTNAVTEMVVLENALLDHYRLQQESLDAWHIASSHVWQARSSTFASQNITLGGAVTRNDVGVCLDGEGAEGTINGLYVISGAQLVDNHTSIDHAKPHCNSFEVYKGILDGSSRGVFNGRILVRPDAQKTDSKQTNKNLLLSPEALVNTNPQLEIYADDVKCTHGATIGQLDENQIFYLRARGIPGESARWMLTYAFANDLVGRIRVEPLRRKLEALFAARLGHFSPGDLDIV